MIWMVCSACTICCQWTCAKTVVSEVDQIVGCVSWTDDLHGNNFEKRTQARKCPVPFGKCRLLELNVCTVLVWHRLARSEEVFISLPGNPAGISTTFANQTFELKLMQIPKASAFRTGPCERVWSGPFTQENYIRFTVTRCKNGSAQTEVYTMLKTYFAGGQCFTKYLDVTIPSVTSLVHCPNPPVQPVLPFRPKRRL